MFGSAISTSVVGIQGRPVVSSAPSTGQVYVWNGLSWAPTFSYDGTHYNNGTLANQFIGSPAQVAITSVTLTSLVLDQAMGEPQKGGPTGWIW